MKYQRPLLVRYFHKKINQFKEWTSKKSSFCNNLGKGLKPITLYFNIWKNSKLLKLREFKNKMKRKFKILFQF